METKYASPLRSSAELISSLFKTLNQVPIIKELVDRTTEIILVLDENRQVVFANQAFIDFLKLDSVEDILGKRPGEALSCEHAEKMSGCGTTEFCIKCGAVNSILGAMEQNREVREECLLSVKGGDSFELFVMAKPFEYMGVRYIIFTAKDISDIKRKNALEKVFFHDIMNLASGIYTVLDLFQEERIENIPPEMVSMLHQSSSEMLREISDYRTLLQAEKCEIKVMMQKLSAAKVLKNLHSLYNASAVRRGVIFELENLTEDIEFVSDPALLNRVVINMIKNAVEASARGTLVSIWAEKTDGRLLISVSNEQVIPQDIQLQIFKRTFTTKPTGSGLGTYSMKMISEKYLSGSVSFISEEGRGTVFTLSIPLGL
jgi:nitrogen-specific signal transduction histidine kinase